MTEPITPITPTPAPVKKSSGFKGFKVAYAAFLAWAESPTGKHTLIAIAAALGTAAEQGIRAAVGH